MILGIRPTIDFVFVKTFGSLQNKFALSSLLNAILTFRKPIVDLELLNPFNLQEFINDKLTILDIKARDADGVIYHIEMQLAIATGLLHRIVYYACDLFASQLSRGEDYSQLQAVYSICLLNGTLWNDSPVGYHRFRLTDTDSNLILEDCLEIHFLELPKYNHREEELGNASTLERRIYWFTHAHEYDAETLRRLFPEPGFQQATESLETIALKSEDKQMYDAREKALRDQHWIMTVAKREAEAKGVRDGRTVGRKEGANIGTIRTCQRALKLPVLSLEELSAKSAEELESLAIQLQSVLFSQDDNG